MKQQQQQITIIPVEIIYLIISFLTTNLIPSNLSTISKSFLNYSVNSRLPILIDFYNFSFDFSNILRLIKCETTKKVILLTKYAFSGEFSEKTLNFIKFQINKFEILLKELLSGSNFSVDNYYYVRLERIKFEIAFYASFSEEITKEVFDYSKKNFYYKFEFLKCIYILRMYFEETLASSRIKYLSIFCKEDIINAINSNIGIYPSTELKKFTSIFLKEYEFIYKKLEYDLSCKKLSVEDSLCDEDWIDYLVKLKLKKEEDKKKENKDELVMICNKYGHLFK